MTDTTTDATRVETRRRTPTAGRVGILTPAVLADLRAMADAGGADAETLPVRRDHLRALLTLPAAPAVELERLARELGLTSPWSRGDSPDPDDAPLSDADRARAIDRRSAASLSASGRPYEEIRDLARCEFALGDRSDQSWEHATQRPDLVQHDAIRSLGEETARRVFYGEMSWLRSQAEMKRLRSFGNGRDTVFFPEPPLTTGKLGSALPAPASPPPPAAGADVAAMRRWAQTVLATCDKADAAAADLAAARAVLGLT